MSENQNTINYLKGMIKGYFIGKKGTNLNIQSLLDKIKELMELEKEESSSQQTETKPELEQEQKTETVNNVVEDIKQEEKYENDLLCLEVNESNVEKVDAEVLELNKKMKRASNQLNLLKQKSRSVKILDRNKLNAIFIGLTNQIGQHKKRLFDIKNFYEKNEIRTKKEIWNLLKHAQKIIDFITTYKIEYTNDPLVFKSIILTMYKKNFNMIDLQGKFLNVKTILDLYFTEENGNLNNYDFYFETIDGKECIKYRVKNSINLNQLNEENITTDIIRKKNLNGTTTLEDVNEDEDEEEEVETDEVNDEEVEEDEDKEEEKDEVKEEDETDEVKEEVEEDNEEEDEEGEVEEEDEEEDNEEEDNEEEDEEEEDNEEEDNEEEDNEEEDEEGEVEEEDEEEDNEEEDNEEEDEEDEDEEDEDEDEDEEDEDEDEDEEDEDEDEEDEDEDEDEEDEDEDEEDEEEEEVEEDETDEVKEEVEEDDEEEEVEEDDESEYTYVEVTDDEESDAIEEEVEEEELSNNKSSVDLLFTTDEKVEFSKNENLIEDLLGKK
jgi:hypothetical protein